MDSDLEKQRKNKQLIEVSTLGFVFPLAIGVGYLMGYGLDRLFHSSPWCTWIFTGLGVVAAFVNLFRMSGGSDDGSSNSGTSNPS